MRPFILLWLLAASGVVQAEDWQRKAVEAYPQLGVAGSELNAKFLALRQERLRSDPEFFKDPRWPFLLAAECAAPPEQEQDQEQPSPLMALPSMGPVGGAPLARTDPKPVAVARATPPRGPVRLGRNRNLRLNCWPAEN